MGQKVNPHGLRVGVIKRLGLPDGTSKTNSSVIPLLQTTN